MGPLILFDNDYSYFIWSQQQQMVKTQESTSMRPISIFIPHSQTDTCRQFHQQFTRDFFIQKLVCSFFYSHFRFKLF
jgi:hypothetical protein